MSLYKELQDATRLPGDTDDDVDGHSESQPVVTGPGYQGYGTHTVLPDVHQTEKSMSKKIKLLKTSCMMLIYLGMGLWAGLVSPTSVDMGGLLNTSASNYLSRSSAKSIGVLLGCFTGAWTADKFRSRADVTLFICNLIGGFSFIALPWSPHIAVMLALFMINGVAHGTLNVVCSSVNIAIWGENAPTPIYMLHMFFTLGTTIAPPIAVPFLFQNQTNASTNVNTTNAELYGSVRIPYAIIGFYSVLLAIVFLVFSIKGMLYTSETVKKRATLKEILNPGSIARGNMWYGVYFLISLFVIYFFVNGRDRGISMFLFVIAHEDVLKMSKPAAAALTTAFNLSSAAGRGISALLSRCINIHIMLYSQLVMTTLLQLMLVFYALESETSLWTLSCLCGFVSAPTYPSVMSWTDRYIEATGIVIAVIDIGIGMGGFTTILTFSHLYESKGSLAVFEIGLVFSLVIFTCLVPLQIISYYRGDRHSNMATCNIVTNISGSREYVDFREPEIDESMPILDQD